MQKIVLFSMLSYALISGASLYSSDMITNRFDASNAFGVLYTLSVANFYGYTPFIERIASSTFQSACSWILPYGTGILALYSAYHTVWDTIIKVERLNSQYKSEDKISFPGTLFKSVAPSVLGTTLLITALNKFLPA